MTMEIEKPRPKRSSTAARRRTFNATEYWKMFEDGYFDGQRVELILGEIIEMPPLGLPHSLAVSRVRKALERAFGLGYWVPDQITLHLSNVSSPDPDVAVLEGDEDAWESRAHPTSALLIVEVADSSVTIDRGPKLQIYAAAKIADYWILNLKTRKLEVYRKPKADKTSQTGWTYASVTTFSDKQSIAPLAKPKSMVKVGDLLPRKR